MEPLSTTLIKQRGFTLVELIMVIVLMGIIGGIMSVFMRGPIDAYFSGARRAALTDVADTTVRRIARDLHRALPNSIRVNPLVILQRRRRAIPIPKGTDRPLGCTLSGDGRQRCRPSLAERLYCVPPF